LTTKNKAAMAKSHLAVLSLFACAELVSLI
jgi:hypothetical protein